MHTFLQEISLIGGTTCFAAPICVQQSRWRKRSRRHSLLVSWPPLGQAFSSLEKEEAVLEQSCKCSNCSDMYVISSYIHILAHTCMMHIYIYSHTLVHVIYIYNIFGYVTVWHVPIAHRHLCMSRYVEGVLWLQRVFVELVMCTFIFGAEKSWCPLHQMNSSILPGRYDFDELVPEC